jgi:hypothetical protein
VAGVVLVDSVHPDLPQQLSAVLPTPAPNESYDLSELRKFVGPRAVSSLIYDKNRLNLST